MKASASPSRTAILLCSVYKSRHGGSLYFQELAQVLKNGGWELGLMSQDETKGDPVFGWQQLLPSFFASGLRNWPARLRDLMRVVGKLISVKPDLLIVQGDLPRLSYIFLQIWVPLMFIRQDSILTCPANDRFLPASRKVCQKPAGFSCLTVDRKESCLGGLSPIKKYGRIVYRLRDAWLIRALKNFTGNSLHILRSHYRPDGVLVRPPGPMTKASREEKRDLHTLVFCGRLERVKGPEEAIWILSLLPETYKLELLGEGDLRTELQELTQRLGLNERVNFRGWVSAEQRDHCLAQAGVLVMTSLCDEAFGMTGVEAFAAGTPVVAYRVGGVAEWCKPNAGQLVECGDRKAAAAAVLKLTSSQPVWLNYSQAGRVHAEIDHNQQVFRDEVLAAVDVCLSHG